jgi:hypothetical protein
MVKKGNGKKGRFPKIISSCKKNSHKSKSAAVISDRRLKAPFI